MFKEKIKDYIGQRLAVKLEPIDKALAKAAVSDEQREKLTLDRKRICEQYVPRAWLEGAANRAKQIQLVTHAPKFTHSDSKSIGALVANQSTHGPILLTTESLSKPELDVVGNAAALDVAGLLKLADDKGQLLADYLRDGDVSVLATFAQSDDELANWLMGFSQAFVGAQPRSHALAKQIYFPVELDYHLLSPLYASSMSYALAKKIRQHAKENKKAREARKKGEACEFPIISYPMLGIVEYGGSKPQNISKLNSELRGRGYLLNCQPPSWRSQAKFPQTSKEFWQQLERSSWRTLKRLREYLEKHRDRDAVSRIKEPRADMVEEIVSNFFQLSAEIRLLGEQITAADDWSLATELTEAEALLLNPHRSYIDAEFKLLRERKDWPEAIGKQFGLWLNQQLKSDKLIFGDVERNHWARIIRNTLSQLRDDLRYLQGGV